MSICDTQNTYIALSCIFSVIAKDYVKLSHDGPVVLGGTITFRADLYTDDGKRPRGTFRYKWTDNSLTKHKYQVIINALLVIYLVTKLLFEIGCI